MARSLRIQYPGAYYHVMARGNRREAIFHDDEDRRFFLHTLAQACEMTGWQVHAWVLMGNHYHLFIRTPEPNLVAGMGWLQNTYTRRYNVRHRAWGRVFGDRYKAVLVEGADRYHYQTLVDYIHLNPVRARIIRPGQGQSVRDYAWSSIAGGYVLPPRKRARWLAAQAGLRAFDLEDSVAGRRRMVERLDERAIKEGMRNYGVQAAPEEMDARTSHLRRGWYWGGANFAEELRDRVKEGLRGRRQPLRSRAYQHTPQSRAHGLTEAERWLQQGLEAAGLKTEDLPGLKGSEMRKVALARLLSRRTVVSQGWIAERLHMGSAANVSQQLRRWAARFQERKPGLPAALTKFIESIEAAS